MATGVHSSLRTSGSARRGGSVFPASQGLLARWQALSPQVRRRLVLGSLLVAVLGVLGAALVRSHDPRELSPLPLQSGELREVSRQLEAWGIAHELNPAGDNLLVAPGEVKPVRRRLRELGVPHQRPLTQEDSPMLPKSRSEQEQQRQDRLAARLAEQIEGLDGVLAAQVNLALRESVFKEDVPSSASVCLTMRPGRSATRALASSISRLVAGAVPGLTSDQVTLVDSSGRALGAAGEDPAESLQQALQARLDSYLEAKVQRMLDRLPGQATVSVCAEYDLSQIQIQRTDVGGAGVSSVPLVEKTSREFFQKAQEQAAEVQVVDRSEDGRSYENLVTARRNKSDETCTFTVHKLPRLNRLSCSVLADAPLRGSREQIEEMVRAASGLDESRGDTLSVVFVPLAPAQPRLAPPLQPGPANPGFPTSTLLGLLLLVPAVFNLVLIVLMVVRAGHERPRVNVARMTDVQPLRGLTDANWGRDGRGPDCANQATLVSELETCARQDPERVARMLKATWMS